MVEHSFRESDIDALSILPLSIIPLRSAGLRNARIVKNSRLQGMFEVFHGPNSGSGQMSPDRLAEAFQIEDENMRDIGVIKRLCNLPSYDVYSLRVSLRAQGIFVEDAGALQLSKEARRILTPYMRNFTRPLVETVYGQDAAEAADVRDMIELFSRPDAAVAQQNLLDVAKSLGVELAEIPGFLADYGDVYLSLAYYRRNLDEVKPDLDAFLGMTRDLTRELRQVGGTGSFQRACDTVEETLICAVDQLESILDDFRARTENMWTDMSQPKFEAIKALIQQHQSEIGGCLCAIVVKLKCWAERFPRPQDAHSADKMNFVVTEMLPGIEHVKRITV